jgi:hypothetical protein
MPRIKRPPRLAAIVIPALQVNPPHISLAHVRGNNPELEVEVGLQLEATRIFVGDDGTVFKLITDRDF